MMKFALRPMSDPVVAAEVTLHLFQHCAEDEAASEVGDGIVHPKRVARRCQRASTGNREASRRRSPEPAWRDRSNGP